MISAVPCYKRNFRVIFFFSDNFFWVAQMAQWFFKLLSLVLLAKWCAKGLGTAWHSTVFDARDLFCFFKNFFAQKSHYTVYTMI